MKIAIVGSSQCPGITLQEWNKKKDEIVNLISRYKEGLDDKDKIVLVSGGSSFSDHLAVELYLECDKVDGLTLYLPAEMTEKAFKESTHPGRELNKRHRAFCQELFGEEDRSLGVLGTIKANEKTPNSVIIVIKPGFLQRNTLIAKDADILIAITIEDKITGGTYDTWSKFGVGKPKHQLLWKTNS